MVLGASISRTEPISARACRTSARQVSCSRGIGHPSNRRRQDSFHLVSVGRERGRPGASSKVDHTTGSEGWRRSMNLLIAERWPIAPPGRMFGWSMTIRTRRPVSGIGFEFEAPGEEGALDLPGAIGVCGTHSALTMRRGTPSTRTVKSPGSRSAIGRPFPSTTVTSTEVTSTPLRNCGRSCACGRTQIDRASVEASSQLYFVASCLCWDAIGKADLIRSALHNLYSNL